MKKFISTVVALSLLCGLLACGSGASASANKNSAAAAGMATDSYTAGTYTASAQGFGGQVTVTLEVDKDGNVLMFEAEGDSETPDVGGAAITKLTDAILSEQSIEVDSISTATVTSKAVLSAAKSCMNQAMGSTEAAEVKMEPGSYTAEAWGYSQVRQVPVTVTVDETNILEIEVDVEAAAETTHLLQTAIDLMLPRIIENNSLSVDAITGATSSSIAVKTAAADCVAQALEAGGSKEEAINAFYVELDLSTGKTETIDVDVVVVGMGGTGTAAATRVAELQAEEGEVSVLALEKAGSYGGTSSATTSLLGFNSGTVKEVFGDDFEYDLEEIKSYLTGIGILGVGNEKAEAFWEHALYDSGSLVDWLVGHGFYFGAPRSGFWGDWSTQFYYCDSQGEANLQSIHDCFDVMVNDYVTLGGEYMLETEGYELIYDNETNTVTGVLARNLVDGTEYIINAKAVIMATGGFGGSTELMSEYNDGEWWLLGMAQNDGKLIQSAIDIGAGVYGMNESMYGGVHNISSNPQLHVFENNFAEDGTTDIWRDDVAAWSLNDVPNIIVASADALWVNTEGERSVDESLSWAWPYAGSTYYAIINQDWLNHVKENGFSENRVELFCNAGYATFPLDTAIPEMDEVLDACIEAGIAVKADTIEELAEMLDAAALAETLNTYNGYCESGVDEEYEKDSMYLTSLDGGPYYAFTAAPRPYSSIGGVDVTKGLEVISSDGETVINGLYAGGTDCLGATAPAFGGELQLWAYMSGYYAAESAVEYIQ